MEQTPLLLLVDDDPQFLEVLSVKLGSEGFRTELARNGEEAVEKARRAEPDFIVLDMKMPGMSGADTLRAIHAEPSLKNVRAVFLSGIIAGDEKQFKIDEKFSKDEGAAGCIQKTDDLSRVVDAIRRYAGFPSSRSRNHAGWPNRPPSP